MQNDELQNEILDWTREAQAGELSWSELAERLLQLEQKQAAPDCPDQDRARRCGFGEVIFGSGKSPETCVTITENLLQVPGQDEVLITRVDAEDARKIQIHFQHSRYSEQGRTLRLSNTPIENFR
ncbi:MAG: hypothetical protein AAF483_12355, partial [Planctomycetota bacterium]